MAASLIADGLKHGTFNRGFTIYIVLIQRDLGFSTAAIAFADMIGRLVGGIQGPPMGYLTDRFGPRVMLAFGGIMSGLGFILLSFTGNYLSFVLVFVGILSVGFRSGYNNASIAAVNNWFRRRRGIAMSIVSMGNGLGGATAPLVGLLVVAVGWRHAVLISGILIIAVVLPLSLLVRRSPESMGLLPDGDPPEPSPPPPDTGAAPASGGRTGVAAAGSRRGRSGNRPQDTDFTAREAMRTPSYWLLILATGLRNTVHSGVSFLLAPMMIWYLQGAGRGLDDNVKDSCVLCGSCLRGHHSFQPHSGLGGGQGLQEGVDRRLHDFRQPFPEPAVGRRRKPLAVGPVLHDAGLRRKRQPAELGHNGRLLRSAGLSPPCGAGNTCRTSSCP